MLLRLWRLLAPCPEPQYRRQEPVIDTVAYVPPPARRSDPRSTAACDHDPPLTRKLSPVDDEDGLFEGERQPGDEVWAFTSPPADWQAKAGRAGVALVRDGTVIRSVVTLLN